MSEPTVDSVLADPSTHYWVSRALREALKGDPVDAARGAEVLAAVLGQRCDAILAHDIAALNANQAGRRCIPCGFTINEHGRCGCIPLDDEAP